MKRFALLMLGLMVLAVPAMADINPLVGDISIYADQEGTSCDLTFSQGGHWYLIHKFDPGEQATGARFKLVVPAEVIIAGSTQYVTIGNLATDLSIAYGFCTNSSIVIYDLQTFGAAPATCAYATLTLPDVVSPYPLATDCDFGEYEMKVGQGIINNAGGCPACNVKAEATSWGKVKALYR